MILQLLAEGIRQAREPAHGQEREAEVAKLDARLRALRPARSKIEALRAALTERAATWRDTLRVEPRVARPLLRRLIGPLRRGTPTSVGGVVRVGGVADARAARSAYR